MVFADRTEAGKRLAEELTSFAGGDAVIIALPRGGVALGRVMADELSLPLDIIVVRKIGHPLSQEYAVGVVNSKGDTILNTSETNSLDAAWLAKETDVQRKEAERRETVYREGRHPDDLKGKTVILTDDGIATGFTMRLALRDVLGQAPRQVIVAVPVASEEAVEMLKKEGADEVKVLVPPGSFSGSVGAHYVSFPQISDREVKGLFA